MANESNNIMIANYRKAIRDLETKLARQQLAAEATAAQIQGFSALIDQLEGRKPAK